MRMAMAPISRSGIFGMKAVSGAQDAAVNVF